MDSANLFEKRLSDDSNTYIERLQEAVIQFFADLERLIRPIIEAIVRWAAELAELGLETYMAEYNQPVSRPAKSQNRVVRVFKHIWRGIFHNRNG